MAIRGRVMKGEDPVAERRVQRLQERREAVTLSVALDRYDADQARRGTVSERKNVLSVLRRNLLGFTKDVPLVHLDRRQVLEAVEALETKGKRGAAKSLRGHASTFLRWCADRGMIPAYPLQGYRVQRATRAEQDRPSWPDALGCRDQAPLARLRGGARQSGLRCLGPVSPSHGPAAQRDGGDAPGPDRCQS